VRGGDAFDRHGVASALDAEVGTVQIALRTCLLSGAVFLRCRRRFARRGLAGGRDFVDLEEVIDRDGARLGGRLLGWDREGKA